MKELEGSKTGSGGPRMTCMIFFFLRPASHQLDLSRSLNGARCGKPDGRMWPASRCFLCIIFFFYCKQHGAVFWRSLFLGGV